LQDRADAACCSSRFRSTGLRVLLAILPSVIGVAGAPFLGTVQASLAVFRIPRRSWPHYPATRSPRFCVLRSRRLSGLSAYSVALRYFDAEDQQVCRSVDAGPCNIRLSGSGNGQSLRDCYPTTMVMKSRSQAWTELSNLSSERLFRLYRSNCTPDLADPSHLFHAGGELFLSPNHRVCTSAQFNGRSPL
jgi:hypothetical protein